MFARTPVQSRWWRLFALAATAFVTPLLLRADTTTEWMRSVATAIALFGVIGYAFGFRAGPRLVWGPFAAVFCTTAFVKLSVFGAVGGHKPVVIALALAMVGAMSLALFRHAELVKGGRQADADEPPEPLLPSRAEQWRTANQRIAEARAVLEQPLSAEMQYDAMSFGPARQMSLKQHQRVTTVMLVGSLVAQLGLAVFIGGNSAILVPAAALAIGCAVSTYLSAELILKDQQRLAHTWKGTAILLALAAGSFVIPDEQAVKLWLVKVVLADVAAMALGALLVTAAYALSRRR